MKKTLEDWHKKYRPRPGDTAEKFETYEEFCRENPSPTIECGYTAYAAWYAKLKAHMEAKFGS